MAYAIGKFSDIARPPGGRLKMNIGTLKKLGSAPAPGVAADALVRRCEQRSASMGRFFLHQPPPGVPAQILNPKAPVETGKLIRALSGYIRAYPPKSDHKK